VAQTARTVELKSRMAYLSGTGLPTLTWKRGH